MKLTYAQIRAFNAVANQTSFSKAADVLGVTQPAITLQIRALENAYSVILFLRKRDYVTLTPIGEALYHVTRSVNMLEVEADALLSQQSNLLQGKLNIAAGSPQLIMPLIKAFNIKYPKVEISLHLGNHQYVKKQLLNNKVDVAILDGHIADDRLISKLYLQQELVLIVTVNHPLADKALIRADDLANETILLRTDGSYTQKIMQEWFAQTHSSITSGLSFNSRDAVIEAVAQNIGVGFVFDKEVGDDQRIKKVKLSGKTTRSNENLVCLKTQYRSSLVKAFFELYFVDK